MVIDLLPVGAYTYALHLNCHNATLSFPNLLVIRYSCFLPHTTPCINIVFQLHSFKFHGVWLTRTCPGTLNIMISTSVQVLA
jgi:hypothetical protein